MIGFEEYSSVLLKLCLASIHHGLEQQKPLPVDSTRYDPALQLHRATFVTLTKQGQLRGCIGSLNATRPVVIDAAKNAYAAAFRDPRFAPIRAPEIKSLDLELSILSEPEALSCRSETELIALLRPGIDGLIIEDRGHRATFLPSVWESLPDARQFVDQLKHKAGLEATHWSDQLKAWRYSAQIISGSTSSVQSSKGGAPQSDEADDQGRLH